MKNFKQYITELSQSAINKAKEKFKKNEEGNKYVELFNKLQTNHIIKNVNIFQLSFEELKKIVDANNVQSKTQHTKMSKQEGAQKMFENDKAIVMWIKSEKASCYYGANTHWCISGKKDNQFNRYNSTYNIFFILPKDKNEKEWKVAVLINWKGEIEEVYDENNATPGDGTKEGELEWFMGVLKDYDIPFNDDIFRSANK